MFQYMYLVFIKIVLTFYDMMLQKNKDQFV